MSTEMTPPPAASADPGDETQPVGETLPIDETMPVDETLRMDETVRADAAEALPTPPAAPAASAASVEPAAPRVRGAAIIWGLLFAVIAFAGIWMLTDDDRRSAAADAITTLTPGTAVSLGLLALGVLVLVSGAVGLIRHAQRRAAAPRA